MQCRARFTTVGSTTINSGLLISGLRAHTAVILAQNLALFLCEPYADTHGRFSDHSRQTPRTLAIPKSAVPLSLANQRARPILAVKGLR